MVKTATTISAMISGMTDAPKEFVDWFEAQRQKRGWGIREAARSIGVSHPTISEIVTYHKQPSFETCVALANAFDVSPTWVMRLAGLLPKEPGYDELTAKIAHLVGQMSDLEKQDVYEYAELITRRRKQRDWLDELKARLADIPPERREDAARVLYEYLSLAGARRVK